MQKTTKWFPRVFVAGIIKTRNLTHSTKKRYQSNYASSFLLRLKTGRSYL